MIALPPGVRVWLATGHTDMRKGFPSLALLVQEVLGRDPLSGHLFCFRGRRVTSCSVERKRPSREPRVIAGSGSFRTRPAWACEPAVL